jgi:hypothetical protein
MHWEVQWTGPSEQKWKRKCKPIYSRNKIFHKYQVNGHCSQTPGPRPTELVLQRDSLKLETKGRYVAKKR